MAEIDEVIENHWLHFRSRLGRETDEPDFRRQRNRRVHILRCADRRKTRPGLMRSKACESANNNFAAKEEQVSR
jgi:hypothetical protein